MDLRDEVKKAEVKEEIKEEIKEESEEEDVVPPRGRRQQVKHGERDPRADVHCPLSSHGRSPLIPPQSRRRLSCRPQRGSWG